MQGQGTEGRAGLQDSILRFSRAENLKITFLQLFEKKGEGRAGQGLGSERLGAGQHMARAKARAKGRAGCRAGRAQAGCSARPHLKDRVTQRGLQQRRRATTLERSWAGHRGQGRVARFHFEVFKA